MLIGACLTFVSAIASLVSLVQRKSHVPSGVVVVNGLWVQAPLGLLGWILYELSNMKFTF